MVIFHSYVTVYQRVNPNKSHYIPTFPTKIPINPNKSHEIPIKSYNMTPIKSPFWESPHQTTVMLRPSQGRSLKFPGSPLSSGPESLCGSPASSLWPWMAMEKLSENPGLMGFSWEFHGISWDFIGFEWEFNAISWDFIGFEWGFNAV